MTFPLMRFVGIYNCTLTVWLMFLTSSHPELREVGTTDSSVGGGAGVGRRCVFIERLLPEVV